MQRALIYLIRAYQKFSRYTPRTCRYEPTCSEYAAQAITRHGALRGMARAAWRILRCNPWSAGGFDPVK